MIANCNDFSLAMEKLKSNGVRIKICPKSLGTVLWNPGETWVWCMNAHVKLLPMAGFELSLDDVRDHNCFVEIEGMFVLVVSIC